jgi:hypothetical protein
MCWATMLALLNSQATASDKALRLRLWLREVIAVYTLPLHVSTPCKDYELETNRPGGCDWEVE